MTADPKTSSLPTSWHSFLRALSAWYLSSRCSRSLLSRSTSTSLSLSWVLQRASPSSTHTKMGTTDCTAPSPCVWMMACEQTTQRNETDAVENKNIVMIYLPVTLYTAFLLPHSQCLGPSPPLRFPSEHSHRIPSSNYLICSVRQLKCFLHQSIWISTNRESNSDTFPNSYN